jgi:hypothetical protein
VLEEVRVGAGFVTRGFYALTPHFRIRYLPIIKASPKLHHNPLPLLVIKTLRLLV